jgi:hypothetical protein
MTPTDEILKIIEHFEQLHYEIKMKHAVAQGLSRNNAFKALIELYLEQNEAIHTVIKDSESTEFTKWDWQPGNGTRYELHYSKTGDTAYITWMRLKGSGTTSAIPEYLHYRYLTEKMQIGIADAVAILEFLEDKGHGVIYPDDRTNYERSVREPRLKQIQ